MNDQRSKAITSGVVLIGLGLAFLAVQFVPIGGALFLFLLGAGFLVAYFAWQRNIGFLIPGAILTGLSIATAWGRGEKNWPLFLIMLGLAFFAVWLFGTRGKMYSWPLWPGTILFVLGGGLWLTTHGLLPWRMWELIGKGWPLILVVIGISLIFGWIKGQEPEHGED